jgi:hypothetical protein
MDNSEQKVNMPLETSGHGVEPKNKTQAIPSNVLGASRSQAQRVVLSSNDSPSRDRSDLQNISQDQPNLSGYTNEMLGNFLDNHANTSFEGDNLNSKQKGKMVELRRLKQEQALLQPSSYDVRSHPNLQSHFDNKSKLEGKSEPAQYSYQNVSHGEPYMNPANKFQDLTSVSQVFSQPSRNQQNADTFNQRAVEEDQSHSYVQEPPVQ